MSSNFSKVVCFDMEMCCWEDKRQLGEIISIGLVELDLATGQTHREAHYYVKPVRDRVSPFCEGLTGITQRMVDRQGRALQDVITTITKGFGARRPYVAWGDDAAYLARECRKHGFTSPFHLSVDAGLLYRIKKRSSENVGLSQALQRAGAEFEGLAHNALVDAKNLATLIVRAELL